MVGVARLAVQELSNISYSFTANTLLPASPRVHATSCSFEWSGQVRLGALLLSLLKNTYPMFSELYLFTWLRQQTDIT